MFGGQDVGPVFQQLRRQARGQGGQRQQFCQRLGAGRQCQIGLPDQQAQGVQLGAALQPQLGDQGAGLLPQQFHLDEIEARGRSHLHPAGKHAPRFGAGGQGLFGEVNPPVQLAHGQPAIGHLGHQQQVGGALAFGAGPVAVQGRFVHAAHAAPHIQFPAGEAHAQLVLAGDHRLAADIQIPRHLRPLRFQSQTHGGAAFGPGNAVGRAGLCHLQHGGLQVAVAVQGLFDQHLQFGVAEVIAPGQLAHIAGLRRAAVCKLCGQGGGWTLVHRGQAGAAGQGQAAYQGHQRGQAAGQQGRQAIAAGGGGTAVLCAKGREVVHGSNQSNNRLVGI